MHLSTALICSHGGAFVRVCPEVGNFTDLVSQNFEFYSKIDQLEESDFEEKSSLL